MNEVQITLITQQRLTAWGRLAVAAHSTPMLLVVAGHDDRKGDVGVFVPEGFNAHTVIQLLKGALRMIDEGKATIVPDGV